MRDCPAFRPLLRGLTIAALTSGTPAAAQSSGAVYDTIIRGGTIVDGSGLEPYTGDVALRGKHVAAVGNLGGASAATILDATGLIVAPGFINIHSHAQPDAVGTAVNMLTQGVTTEITNADGHGTTDIAKQLAGFTTNGLAENIGLYIGFNAAWLETMGHEDRPATAAEIAKMQSILDSNLAQGAWGVAAGLDYRPAYYAKAEQVVEIVSVARKWRTNFPNHDRLRPEEQYSSYKGISETISIGEKAGLVPVITHMKSQGNEQGNAPAVVKLLDAANARGTYTAADLYPYLAGLSGLSSLMVPGWAVEGGREAMLKRFADPPTRARIIAAVETAMKQRFGGAEGVFVLNTGRELADVMKEMRAGPGEAVLRLLEKQEYSAILRFGREDDLATFLRYRNSAMACDCGASTGTRVHPRNWGSFPRVLGRYVRDISVLTLPDAIRKMTGLPATLIGMADRGFLAPGMSGDVTIFDPKTVQDHATYQEPTKPSEGVRHVFVNGRQALRDGQPTGAKAGEIVLRTRHMPSRPMTAPDHSRRASSLATVSNGRASFVVSVALKQEAGERYARGHFQLLDLSSNSVWVGDRLGILQVAPGWSSLTAILRDISGNLRPATITIDRAGAAKPAAVLNLDGREHVSAPVVSIPTSAQSRLR